MSHLALSGKMGSGKSTAAKLIVRELQERGKKAKATKFASRLYTLCAAIDGATEWDEHGWELVKPLSSARIQPILESFVNEHTHLTPSQRLSITAGLMALTFDTPTVIGVKNRARLRGIAEYVRQNIGHNTWVEYLRDEIKQARSAGELLIISDLRTLHEAYFCCQENISMIRIDVLPEVQRLRLLAAGSYRPEDNFHRTENELDQWDRFATRIDNSSSYEELKAAIASFVSSSYAPSVFA